MNTWHMRGGWLNHGSHTTKQIMFVQVKCVGTTRYTIDVSPGQDGFPLFQGVIAAYIQGIEEEKCSAVSLPQH
jgi:hypothetical protein